MIVELRRWVVGIPHLTENELAMSREPYWEKCTWIELGPDYFEKLKGKCLNIVTVALEREGTCW